MSGEIPIATLHPGSLQNLSHIVYALSEGSRSEKQTFHWRVDNDGIFVYELPELRAVIPGE